MLCSSTRSRERAMVRSGGEFGLEMCVGGGEKNE